MEHLRERLRTLLQLLLDALDARQDSPGFGADEMQEMVAAAGYRDEDMQDLLAWLQSRWSPATEEPAWLSTRLVNRAGGATLRQMGSGEDELLTPDAFGYLLDLVRTGQLAAEQMESLIQFAQLAPDGPLTVTDVATLMDRVVFTDLIRSRPGATDRSHSVH